MPVQRVLEQRVIGPDLYALTFSAPLKLSEGGYEPGQFLHLRVTDSFDFVLRRPLSLCQVHVERNAMTVMYRAQGAGTRRLARLRAGDAIDVLGPLGKGFPLHEKDRRALLIGGGIGVPPLVELARRLYGRGCEVISVIGFQTADQIILREELKAYGRVHLVTDDGTEGERGRVTDVLTKELCADVSRYYACGPTPMLRAVQTVMREREIPGYLSLEERMGCGIGICVGCVHTVRREGCESYVKTCVEGPVFLAEEVVFS
ncbi:dihydroorotate dehydrogenase electron transfer subunit [Ferroacidibacillus organovorans]|uniref:Dihydroorotate dehydrogenase B (NAD(+)), electron transfer subunit n=1 Tax=Ferroacidibacillus organovorans TaxID=1765683 RepID=A0A124IVW8_9BACL|nr:dihydroorotate dehydrogenase electron transfer subunit [Ferroacidibacillus organovorans]KUO95581.1 hypothetical protein ATW55_06800 [Ferroacidibacillus organovorans]